MKPMFARARSLSPGQKLMRFPWVTFVVVAALCAIGVVTLYSVGGGSAEPWAMRHGVRCGAGLALIVACAVVPIDVWRRLALPIYVAVFAVLILVPVMGVDALGARRWLTLGGLSFQPSEVMKLAMVFALATYYQALPAHKVSYPGWLVVPLVLIAGPVMLTLRQPDLGSAVMLAAVGCGTVFVAGVSLWYFAAGAGVLAVGLPLLAPHLHDYQRRRIDTFLNPESDPLGAGYHITQAKIALAAGGVSGQGLLKGTQTQLDFVPEKMTDFVFVMIGEEWGFVGAASVLVVYGVLIAALIFMAMRARDRFARLMIMGPALMVMAYVSINVAMVTGIVPVVGVPLPLISYGGTSLMTLMWGIGVAMSAHVHRPQSGSLAR
jgi:rod shape determining protein RodA